MVFAGRTRDILKACDFRNAHLQCDMTCRYFYDAWYILLFVLQSNNLMENKQQIEQELNGRTYNMLISNCRYVSLVVLACKVFVIYVNLISG